MKILNDLEKLLPTVEFFDFTGGEPLLIKKHYALLRKAVELGYAKNIKIHYNTNGTVMPPKDMFEVWKEFKHVEVMFSIDGIYDKFEYMRHPAKWNTFIQTLNTFKEKDFASITLCHTISAFNIYYVDEFLETATNKINFFKMAGSSGREFRIHVKWKCSHARSFNSYFFSCRNSYF